MNQEPTFSEEDQASLTQRLQEWIRKEKERGISMESILYACQECGIIPLADEEESEEIPEIGE